MNMPPISRDVLLAASMHCFCGQICPPESYYCSLDCAREDAFNALTLGKPHESSKPPMPPLPTLPKDFFKLPPKRSLDDADELVFTSCDHGPFQAKDPKKTSVPRSVTTSIPSTASKRRSHYQRTQQRECEDASLDISFFLVDEKHVGISDALGIDSSGPPNPIPEPRLARPISFDLFSPAYPCAEGSTLTPYDYTAGISHQRSSSSSHNSLLTSGTSRSRSSFMSSTGPSEPSPTSSEYPASLSQSQPRLGYGSAFGGGDDDKPLTVDLVRMAEDMRDSLLLAKRSSRKRSSTDATLLTVVRQDLPRKELPLHRNDPISKPPNNIHSSVPRNSQLIPPKKASTSVPRSQWPQFGISTSRSEQRIATVVAPVPMQLHTTNASSSRPVLGTVVKKTTIATKGRLPIGTPHQVPQRPMTPSNTLPTGINLSLHSKSFCAPAYAMSAPKLPSSTRALHTSPSVKSLKGQKEQFRVQLPGMELEHHKSPEAAFKPGFELKPSVEAEDSKGPDILVVNDDNLTSSTLTGLPFKLSTAPKPPRSLNLTLNMDSATISTSTPQLIRRASPPCALDRSPSTAGGPFTPRATPIGSRRPVWLVSPIDNSAKSDFFYADGC